MSKLLDWTALFIVWGIGGGLLLLLFYGAWRVGGLGPLLVTVGILATGVWASKRVSRMRQE